MTRKAQASKKASSRNVVLQVEQIVQPGALSMSFGRIGGNLTPAAVTNILIAADTGYPAQLVDLTHEARQKDGHLQSVLQTRELAIQRLQWDCIAPEGARKRDKKVAGLAKEALRQCKALATLIAHHVGESTLFGHATSEIMWQKRDDGLIVPTHFEPLSCRRFVFEQTGGKLVFVENPLMPTMATDLLAAYPDKFIQSRRRVNGDVPVREGLCRTLMWAALFRNWTVADWLKLAELAWKPWRMGKFKKGAATTADVAALRRILESMTANGMAVYPDSYDVSVTWPQQAASNAGSNHFELAEFMAREMSKAVIGGTDTVEPGKNGARASTEVRNEVRHDIRDADAMALGEDIRRFIVEPFVRLNFGPSAVVPEFFFLTDDPADLEKFANAIAKLRAAGLRIPTSYVYDQTGIPEPKADDELLVAPPTPPPAGGPTPEPPPDGNTQNQQQQEANAGTQAAA